MLLIILSFHVLLVWHSQVRLWSFFWRYLREWSRRNWPISALLHHLNLVYTEPNLFQEVSAGEITVNPSGEHPRLSFLPLSSTLYWYILICAIERDLKIKQRAFRLTVHQNEIAYFGVQCVARPRQCQEELYASAGNGALLSVAMEGHGGIEWCPAIGAAG